MIDRERMEQALWQIVCNAYEHGLPPVVLTVAEAGDWLECGVGDCGAGFDHDPLAPPVGPAVAGGSPRFGLWLATRIIEAHGGRLWVGRARCGGAHIGFRLPAARGRTCRQNAG